ncbi:MAG: rRNA methyltransferase [Ponticaulis sp.]|nr:rRNA methyltransferase [Ponticaulis sp.]|tara:strand:- start:8753 stop:9274 length:522 start_codon:yes stop_codon:yes gene_type:complete
MRGYFAIGAEGISKPMNLGALMRTSHAFGASFVFSVGAAEKIRHVYRSDTSKTFEHVPYYQWDTKDDMALPRGCTLVGVELTDEAEELPEFRHPTAAAYILGRERGSLSSEMIEKCAYTVKIPTKFCVNVSVAGALVMYDRMISMGRFAERPVTPGRPVSARELNLIQGRKKT